MQDKITRRPFGLQPPEWLIALCKNQPDSAPALRINDAESLWDFSLTPDVYAFRAIMASGPDGRNRKSKIQNPKSQKEPPQERSTAPLNLKRAVLSW